MSAARGGEQALAQAAVPALKARALLALAAGAALPCAFAPYGLWPLALLAPAVLLFLIVPLPSAAAARLGAAFGLGLFGHGVWWIQVSVHQFGVPFYAFSVTATALFVCFMASYVALFAWLLARMARTPVQRLVLAPPLWVLVETLRGTLFTGFPWLSLGYSQVDAPLGGFAPLGGVPLCSLLVMVVAAALAGLPAAGWRQRAALLLLALLPAALGAGLRTRTWTTPGGVVHEVVLVQGAVPQHLKWAEDLRSISLARYLELSAAAWAADLVIWPETAIPAFASEVPEVIAELEQRARAQGTALLVGMPTGEPWNGRYYNSVVQFGAESGRYDKRHLVPFGEFFPFKSLLGNLILLFNIPMSDFTAGTETQPLLTVAGHTVGVSICYEDAYAQAIAGPRPLPDVLVNVSNDAWFGDTIAPHQHLEIARMRALESGRWLLRSTNTGISAVIDDRGMVRARAPQFVPHSLRSTYTPMHGETPYARLGDWPLRVLLALLVAGLAWRARRGGRGGQRAF